MSDHISAEHGAFLMSTTHGSSIEECQCMCTLTSLVTIMLCVECRAGMSDGSILNQPGKSVTSDVPEE